MAWAGETMRSPFLINLKARARGRQWREICSKLLAVDREEKVLWEQNVRKPAA